METDKDIQQLVEEYSQFDWYDSVGLDKSNRYIVYTKLINREVMKVVRQDLNGTQVLVAFAHAKPSNDSRSRYINFHDFSKSRQQLSTVITPIETVKEDTLDLDYLIAMLDKMEKWCGSNNILQDIFYEIHDGKNAVTNLSTRFPHVREELNKLYETYGFDIIYEELDG